MEGREVWRGFDLHRRSDFMVVGNPSIRNRNPTPNQRERERFQVCVYIYACVCVYGRLRMAIEERREDFRLGDRDGGRRRRLRI